MGNGGDEYFAVVSPSTVTEAAVVPPRPRINRLVVVVCVVLLAVIAVVTVLVLRRSGPPPELPLSDPPPNGGSLDVPPTLGGAPLASTSPPDRSWLLGTLPQYDSEDVLWKYYDARAQDGGVISVIALRGPAEDLPDPDALGHSEDWTLQDVVECGRIWVDPIKGYDVPGDLPDEPVKTDGHLCWRSSGNFSVSVLTFRQGLTETASLVNEFWTTQ
ncbi:MAG: hypothetical protein ABI586_00990 [Candidatus Nanopelagicales bacterium]